MYLPADVLEKVHAIVKESTGEPIRLIPAKKSVKFTVPYSTNPIELAFEIQKKLGHLVTVRLFGDAIYLSAPLTSQETV